MTSRSMLARLATRLGLNARTPAHRLNSNRQIPAHRLIRMRLPSEPLDPWPYGARHAVADKSGPIGPDDWWDGGRA